MGIITEIKRQKDGNRLNIYIDDKFAFGVDREVWLKQGFKKGEELESGGIESLQGEDSEKKAWDKVLHFLSFRPRSEKEVREKIKDLKEKLTLSKKQEEELFQKLEKYNYVNDEEFGKWWIEQRKKRLKGEKVVKQELFLKGLKTDLIEKLLKGSDLGPNEELLSLLEKNRWRLEKDPTKTYQKAVNMLLRRGYDWESVKETVAIFLTERGEKE